MVNEPDFVAELGELRLHLGGETATIEGPGPRTPGCMLPPDPEVIREWVRTDGRGRYRPLPGARGLRPGWYATFDDLEAFARAVDAVYPLAQRHLAEWAEGTLRVTDLDAVLDRQSGRYAVARELPEAGRAAIARVLCAGACVKTPLWRDPAALRCPPAGGEIPCPEPCSVFVAFAREAALWEHESPTPVPPDPDVPFADFETPGNTLREAYLALEPARD